MDSRKVRVRCKDCGRQRAIEVSSMLIPIIGSFFCISDGRESEANRCPCGCEAFDIIDEKA
jgi:hypothetical protein